MFHRFLSALGRAVLGAFAGAALGLVADATIFRRDRPEGGLSFAGTVTGALVCSVAGAALGARALPPALARLAKGLLGGAVAGLLLGALVYPRLYVLVETGGRQTVSAGLSPSLRIDGVTFGTPLGATVGAGLVAVGLARTHRPAKTDPAPADLGQRDDAGPA